MRVLAQLVVAALLAGCGGGASAAEWRALRPATLERTEVAAARIGDAHLRRRRLRARRRTTAAVERYDIAATAGARVRSMPVGAQPRRRGRLHGDLYVVGGYTDGGRGDRGLLRYDPERDRWTRLRRCRPRAAR